MDVIIFLDLLTMFFLGSVATIFILFKLKPKGMSMDMFEREANISFIYISMFLLITSVIRIIVGGMTL